MLLHLITFVMTAIELKAIEMQLEKVNSNPDRFTKLNIQLIILHGPKTTTM